MKNRYRAMGWPIFPCKDKKPLVEWRNWKWDERKWQNANQVGLETGKLLGVVVVDVDGRKNAPLFPFPTTVFSPRGKHFYFRWNQGINNAQDIFGQRKAAGGDGVDIRGEGGYVILPPSMHPSGVRYRWRTGYPPKLSNLPPFPRCLLEKRQAGFGPGHPDSFDSLSASLDGLTEGQRRPKLLSIVGSLYNHYSAESIEKLLTPLVEKIGLPTEELRRLIYATKGWTKNEQQAQEADDEIKIKTIHEWTGNKYTIQQEFVSGFKKLDGLLFTFQRGHIFCIAARTGLGKTAVFSAIANHLTQEQAKRVLYFSTEMSEDDMRRRGALFPICDKEQPNINQIEKAIVMFQPEIFIFDHFNVIGTDSHQLAAFMRGLKSLARKYNIACLLAAQFNRLADVVNPMNGKKVRPRLSHIQGSSAVEQFSAQVLLLDENQKHDNGVFFTGYLDKNRFGRLGEIQFEMRYEPFGIYEL